MLVFAVQIAHQTTNFVKWEFLTQREYLVLVHVVDICDSQHILPDNDCTYLSTWSPEGCQLRCSLRQPLRPHQCFHNQIGIGDNRSPNIWLMLARAYGMCI